MSLTPLQHGGTRSVEIDAALVARLVKSQFPQWSGLPITAAEPNGWDNRTFRLGSARTAAIDDLTDVAMRLAHFLVCLEQSHPQPARICRRLDLAGLVG